MIVLNLLKEVIDRPTEIRPTKGMGGGGMCYHAGCIKVVIVILKLLNTPRSGFFIQSRNKDHIISCLDRNRWRRYHSGSTICGCTRHHQCCHQNWVFTLYTKNCLLLSLRPSHIRYDLNIKPNHSAELLPLTHIPPPTLKPPLPLFLPSPLMYNTRKIVPSPVPPHHVPFQNQYQ